MGKQKLKFDKFKVTKLTNMSKIIGGKDDPTDSSGNVDLDGACTNGQTMITKNAGSSMICA